VLGLAALAYVIHGAAPDRQSLVKAFVVAGGCTFAFISARRGLALEAHAGSVSYWHEMLAGGVALPHSPYPLGAERMAGGALWLLLWAVFLHPGTGDEDGEGDRGPWILALVPLLLMVLFSLVPLGLTPEERPSGHRSETLRVVGIVFVVYVGLMALYWSLRRRAARH